MLQQETLTITQLSEWPSINPNNCSWLKPNWVKHIKTQITYLDEVIRHYDTGPLTFGWLNLLINLPSIIDQHRDICFSETPPSDVEVPYISRSYVDPHATIGANCVINNSVIYPNVTIKPFSLIENSVIYPGSYVYEHASIKKVIAGSDSQIGTGALVLNSIIGRNTIIGCHREISRSLVGSNVEIQHFGTFLDSIACDYSYLAGDTGTRNHREDSQTISIRTESQTIDTQLIKLGLLLGPRSKMLAGSKTMPGVIIGSNVTVKADTIVYQSLPDNSRIGQLHSWQVLFEYA
jgi:acetyltransferase-like isoleucine patch superfamily enzyme